MQGEFCKCTRPILAISRPVTTDSGHSDRTPINRGKRDRDGPGSDKPSRHQSKTGNHRGNWATYGLLRTTLHYSTARKNEDPLWKATFDIIAGGRIIKTYKTNTIINVNKYKDTINNCKISLLTSYILRRTTYCISGLRE